MLQVEHVWRNLVTQGQYSENRGGRSSGSQHVAHGGFRGRNGGDSFGSKAMMLNDGRKNPCMASVASRSVLHDLSNTPQGSSEPFIHDCHC